MSFNYPYTCGEIDSAQDNVRKEIKSNLMELLEFFLEDTKMNISDLSQEYMERIYDAIVDEYENVRQTNKDMRKEAENVIDRLESELDELNSDLKSKNDEIEYLEDQISDLNKEVDDLIERLKEHEIVC